MWEPSSLYKNYVISEKDSEMYYHDFVDEKIKGKL